MSALRLQPTRPRPPKRSQSDHDWSAPNEPGPAEPPWGLPSPPAEASPSPAQGPVRWARFDGPGGWLRLGGRVLVGWRRRVLMVGVRSDAAGSRGGSPAALHWGAGGVEGCCVGDRSSLPSGTLPGGAVIAVLEGPRSEKRGRWGSAGLQPGLVSWAKRGEVAGARSRGSVFASPGGGCRSGEWCFSCALESRGRGWSVAGSEPMLGEARPSVERRAPARACVRGGARHLALAVGVAPLPPGDDGACLRTCCRP